AHYQRFTGFDSRIRLVYFFAVIGMSSVLNQHVLVLNRLWQAVNICTARRALTLLFQGHAQAVLGSDDGSFRTYDFTQWYDFSLREPHPESIKTISFRIRVPRVILLVMF